MKRAVIAAIVFAAASTATVHPASPSLAAGAAVAEDPRRVRVSHASSMRELVDELCSDRCAGRAAGTEGGRIARGVVIDALRTVGLDPFEQAVPKARGANVLATIPGEIDRYVMVAAHYDHLGTVGRHVYRGADDNAASVAILVDVARRLAAARPMGRGVIIAAFDAEEPPYFLTAAMGSEHFARHPTVPLERIDMMVCLELVGHALGDAHRPSEVRRTMFLLGAERSEGTLTHVHALARTEPGLIIRPADAEVIPRLSDYAAFWERERPFVLLTGGRSRHYHTPDDLPQYLDFARMQATAAWIERFVREQCARHEAPFVFRDRRDDATTLDSIGDLLTPLATVSDVAAMGAQMARSLRARVRRDGALPHDARGQLEQLVAGIESSFA
ncbi:Peptidase M28 [Sandaracinus amylolyticus]|uniref:Peptidase M28 n=1 Tax=Sandaracinus amylolyticus TaxID=927083 RepID=A0A0F6W4R8_9BACT|nr:Peptidase M28 [Sandaracinus amylolyticus]